MKYMRIITLALALALATAMVSCGNGDSTDNNSNNSVSSAENVTIDNSNGYVAAMTAAAGLNMEKSSVDDITAKFGQPTKTANESRNEINCTILTYSFGELYFEERDGQQTLTFAIITDKLPEDIYGVNMGDDMYTVAETIYPGCTDKIKSALTAAESGLDSRAVFYGDVSDNSRTPPYGYFQIVDIEQSDETSMYTLEYAVPSEVGGYAHTINLTFDREMKLSCIIINCSEIF